ncbi:hypothetical protein M3Y99_01615100 [Aphelenchoides fujianensis]|nr:hypothetical protein M3Y99_01615100 [Aphelenchoides fujianensis]
MDASSKEQGECHVCGVQRTRYLAKHIAKHFDEGAICSLCGIREQTFAERNRHERTIHGFHRTDPDRKFLEAVRIGPKTKETLRLVGKNFEEVQRDAVQAVDYDNRSPPEEGDAREENEDPTYEQLDGSSSGLTNTSFQPPPPAVKTPSTAGRKRASISVLANQSNSQAAEDADESPAPKWTRTLRSSRAHESNVEQRPAATGPNAQEPKPEYGENSQQHNAFSQSLESAAGEDSDGDEVKLEAGDRRASLVPAASSSPTQQSVAARKKKPSGSHVVCFAKKNTSAITNEFKLILNERRTFQAVADAAFQLCARPELVDSALILAREADKKKIADWAKGPFVVV